MLNCKHVKHNVLVADVLVSVNKTLKTDGDSYNRNVYLLSSSRQKVHTEAEYVHNIDIISSSTLVLSSS